LGAEQRGKRRGGERSEVLLLLGSAGDGERSGVLLLLGSAGDGEVGLLELRCGGVAIHFLPPFLLMARRRWTRGPYWIQFLLQSFESSVPWRWTGFSRGQ
jgi:hypothetical protein